ncbi:acyl-CoA dehydrogenase [Chelatococcus reniformis]|uniref:Acyl-CoA dehydrogenase n=1 Tax=Chelatococcus reniformis TaxID=1494448 RepID=A0A916UJQ5_9HYPH|nr:acyl-CoA dehydrogenase [Chelatococcus reniformis]GGC75483.1 putative acyl-CoA dehydrogenase [Chelatococcus reniformis]
MSSTASSARSLSEAPPDFQLLFDTIAAGAAERDRDRVLPFDIMDRLRESRIGALRLAKADGGAGLSHREQFRVVIALAAADPNVAHILRNHFSFVERFARPKNVPHRDKWAKLIASGAIVGLANTELNSPKVGAVPYETRLTTDGDGYRLDGVKYYSTGTLFSDVVQVRATAPDDRPVSVIIPTRREGVELVDDWDGAGQRLTGSGTTRLHDVRVEADEVVFDVPGLTYSLTYNNTLAQLLVTAIVAGILRSVLQDAKALVISRKDRNFYYANAARAADDPLLQQVIGEIASNAFAAEALILTAADAQDELALVRERGLPDEALAHTAAEIAAKTKIVVDELTLRSANRLFDAGGASALQRTKNLDRHWRNARTLANHNPSVLKAQALGAYELSGEPLPGQGFF